MSTNILSTDSRLSKIKIAWREDDRIIGIHLLAPTFLLPNSPEHLRILQALKLVSHTTSLREGLKFLMTRKSGLRGQTRETCSYIIVRMFVSQVKSDRFKNLNCLGF